MKFIISQILIFLSLGGAHCQAQMDVMRNREILREYFLFSCIKHGFENKEFISEDCSASIYLDISSYAPEAFRKIDSLAIKHVQTITPSPIEDLGNRRAIILLSIDKFKSKELEIFVQSLDSYLVDDR